MNEILHGNLTYEYESLPDYQITVKEYASGMIEVVQRLLNKTQELARSRSLGIRGIATTVETSEEERARKDEENIQRAARRARKAVATLVKSIGADHLLTLTYRDNISDTERLDRDFTKFIRLVREKLPEWRYVAVRELQERGSLHMHIACVGKQDIEHLRACWYTALGGLPTDSGENTKGAVNVVGRKKRFSGQSPIYSALQLSTYLTKYISKTFESDHKLGMRRYKASRNIPLPKLTKHYYGQFSLIPDGHDFPAKMFSVAAQETIRLAMSLGIKDMQIWNNGTLEIFVVRGVQHG